jgi:predicted membrane protein
MQKTQVARPEPLTRDEARFTRAPSEDRDLPDPPPLRRLLGPSVILIGVGIASGEYILFPFIASQAGLVFLWAAVVGILMQFFINREIERYTLATGETAVIRMLVLMWAVGLFGVMSVLVVINEATG